MHQPLEFSSYADVAVYRKHHVDTRTAQMLLPSTYLIAPSRGGKEHWQKKKSYADVISLELQEQKQRSNSNIGTNFQKRYGTSIMPGSQFPVTAHGTTLTKNVVFKKSCYFLLITAHYK